VTKTKHYATNFKNSRGNIFSKQSRVNEWQLVTTEEIYVALVLVMLMGTAQKSSLRVYFSRNQIVDHLKFRTDLVEGLLVKYSVLHGVSGHHDGEGIIKRLTKCHFPRRIPATEKKCKPTKCVFSIASITKDERLYTIVNTAMLLCRLMSVSRPTIQRKFNEVM